MGQIPRPARRLEIHAGLVAPLPARVTAQRHHLDFWDASQYSSRGLFVAAIEVQNFERHYLEEIESRRQIWPVASLRIRPKRLSGPLATKARTISSTTI